jgi:predicted nuclease of predicted toxin-antitoxin system
MKLLADTRVAPRTVAFLQSLGHDVIRVADLLMPSASDEEIIAAAIRDERAILTQDLDFTDLVALRPAISVDHYASARVLTRGPRQRRARQGLT